jgi:hypothetical protein
MGDRLESALQFNRKEIQAGIDEAETELVELQERTRHLTGLITKGRQVLEGGTADLSGQDRMTLHEAIRFVLREHDNEPMTARELADEITQRDLYMKRDGSPVEINQVHARVNNYGSMFEKVGNRIRVRDT